MTSSVPTPQDIFLFVFREIKFPYLAVDLQLLSEVIQSNADKEPQSFIDFPLQEYADKRQYLMNSLRGIIQNFEVPRAALDLMETSLSMQVLLTDGKGLKMLAESAKPFFATRGDAVLTWVETTYWPAAYYPFFNQLLNLTLFFKAAMAVRKKELLGIDIYAEYPRMMPTAIHYAFASLGAWLGGAVNMIYFSHYATDPQIRDDDINKAYLQKINYDATTAKELSESGIIGLPATLLSPLMTAQNNFIYFGSLAVDEWNLANGPDTGLLEQSAEEIFEKDQLPGFIMDKYYRTPFRARKISSQGLLGVNTVLRDHYTEFYDSINYTALLRCKHYSAPIIEVSSVDELEQYIRIIPIRDKEGLFFRGQTSLYTLRRSDRIKKLLFSNSCNEEPSLVTAAARSKFDYDSIHFAIRYFLMESLKYNPTFQNEKGSNLIREKQQTPLLETEYAIMALAQHYGIPSHGLDITKNIDTALWFATNKYTVDDKGFARYKTLKVNDWDKNDSSKWPIIFACQAVTHTTRASLHNCQELDEVGITALRPIRQSARFYLGGHSEHQNRLAETVVCAFRLKPNYYKTTVDFDYLFPTPAEDKAYAFMLEFASNSHFQSIGANKVNKFH